MNYVYDIYINGSRNFYNKCMQINTLFENYEPVKDSINFFNEKFNDVNVVIPYNINEDIYTIYVFKVGENSYITIVNVNIDEFNTYYDKHNSIANNIFFSLVCKYHMLYNSVTYDRIEKEIIDKVNIPVYNITDSSIQDIMFLNKDIVLRDYQKKSIKWMYDLENSNNMTQYNDKFKYLLDIGNKFSFNILTKEIISKSYNKNIIFKGGALIDDIGNGKTLQAIVLSILNYAKDISLIKNNTFNSRATLVLSPNHISKQWIREIKNMISLKLKIVSILDKTDYENCTYMDVLDADFVFVSHEFLGNQSFTSKYVEKITKVKSYHKSYLWDNDKVSNVFNEISSNLITKTSTLFDTEPIFPIIKWHRIIVDEFHEIFTVLKYNHVKNILPHFKSNHKWVLTGTPFGDQNVLVYILNFLTDYDTSLNIHIPDVKDYVCSKIFRRNLKDFNPIVKEKIIWLQLTFVEKMMYNAYKNDNSLVNNEILRQICCHPKIADDIKIVLNECKTLKDIETSMVKHYEEQYIAHKNKVELYQKYISKIQRCITLSEYRLQKKLLKKEGYKVSIEKIPDIAIDNSVLEQDNLLLNNNSDSEPELEQKENSNKTIIINSNTQKEIIKILGNKLDYTTSSKIVELYDLLVRHNDNLIQLTKLMEGKKSSYIYFKTVVDKIKHIIDKTVEENCCICLSEIIEDNIGITQCGHIFCYSCLKMSIDSNFKCPLCKTKQTKKDISMVSYENTNKEDTLIDNIGTKLSKLIKYLKSIDEHSIIFSQWDILLDKVGETLDQHGIKNVFCKGHLNRKDKAIMEFTNSHDIKVIMLSSKNSASGINLTKATKIIFLDPVSGSYDYRKSTELQAIGRAVRLGQTKTVEIVRFMIRDTIEEEIYNENKENDLFNNIYNNEIEEIDD